LACGLRKGRFAVADGEAHQSQRTVICFPLYIRLLPFLPGVPWRSFTLSMPLQHGLWLLRRLRPPSRPRAFSRPTYVGETRTEFPSSTGREKKPVAASCTPGGVRNNVCRTESRHTNRLPFWVGCVNHFHPLVLTTLTTEVPCVSIGPRAGRSSIVWFTDAELLSARYRPWPVPQSNAWCVALMSLSRHNSLWNNLFRR
jgi:hypothetical protein